MGNSEFSDWDHVERICGPINAEALLQLKRIARDFKNDRTREYENVQRKLNKVRATELTDPVAAWPRSSPDEAGLL